MGKTNKKKSYKGFMLSSNDCTVILLRKFYTAIPVKVNKSLFVRFKK